MRADEGDGVEDLILDLGGLSYDGTAETMADDSVEVSWCICIVSYEQERGKDLVPRNGRHSCQVLDMAFNWEENNHQLWNRRRRLNI